MADRVAIIHQGRIMLTESIGATVVGDDALTWEMLVGGRWSLLTFALGAKVMPVFLLSALRLEGGVVFGLWPKSRFGPLFSTPNHLWVEVTPGDSLGERGDPGSHTSAEPGLVVFPGDVVGLLVRRFRFWGGMVVGFSALVVSPLATAPLALTWNRNR